jgi:two-component system sensor histidine kinase PilS (NtrC family)
MQEGKTDRLRAFIFIRALVVTVLLGAFYLFEIEYTKLPYPTVFRYLIAAQYILTILYAVALRWIKTDKGYTFFSYFQISMDIMGESCLVFLTGGIASRFSFLFPLSIISASIILNRRASYVFAVLASILYGLLIDLQFYRVIPETTDYIYSNKEYFYTIFANISAFFLVAFLSGYLAEKLLVTTRSLEEKNVILSDLRAFSRDIVESIPSGILTTDLNNRIISFNTAAQEITQYGLDDVMNRTPTDIFPFLSDIRPTERVEGEIFQNKEKIIIGIRFSVLKNSAGEPTGMIGVFQDLTSLKAMEEDVKRKEKWASIGELSALIAHELRNPLAALKASVEMLYEKSTSTEHAEQLMKIAISEMDRLNRIVTDFLLYAKPVQQNRKPFDLHQSLSDIITLLQSSETSRKNVKIVSHLTGKLFIHGDSRQLQQVFWNLGLNAVHAVKGDGTVTISTENRSDTVRIEFRDTGLGLKEEDLKKIFFPFYTTKEKGTGLGLSIAQRIIEEHRGRITVESNGTGSGSVFSVELPVINK